MLCPNCGIENAKNANFCSRCGYALQKTDTPATPTASVTSKGSSGFAIAGFVCGLVGIIPYFGFILGILAIIFSSIARNEIKTKNIKTGGGLAIVGLILGIVDLLIGLLIIAAIAIPNFISMQQRAQDASVKSQMHMVQIAMEDFSTQKSGGSYPISMDSQTDDGKTFRELLPGKKIMINPFTKLPTSIKFFNVKGGLYHFPDDSEVPNIPPGDIDVYSDGLKYYILGGGKNGQALSLRLTSE